MFLVGHGQKLCMSKSLNQLRYLKATPSTRYSRVHWIHPCCRTPNKIDHHFADLNRHCGSKINPSCDLIQCREYWFVQTTDRHVNSKFRNWRLKKRKRHCWSVRLNPRAAV